MCALTLTPQQKIALETKGVDVALSAGAGCGKTFVLARRFLGEIRPPAGRDLSRVAALTFTNKAARELRERVRSYCRAELKQTADPAEREGWLRLVRELESAPISTFHVFCKGILKRFNIPAGLDPGFGILEGALGNRMRDEAVTEMLREALAARDPDLWPIAIEYGLGFVESCIASLLPSQEFDEVAPLAAGDSGRLLQRWTDLYIARLRPSLVAQIQAKAEQVTEQLRSIDCGFNPRMRERQAQLLELIPQLSNSDRAHLLLPEIREHATIQYVTKWPDPDVKEALKVVFEELRAEIDRQGQALSADPNLSGDVAILVGRLARLAMKASRVYDDLKNRSGVLDYNDLLLRTRSLVRSNAGDVRDALAANLDAILIDEFQDTDPIQEEIVRAIAGKDRLGGRLYVVGDVKQSIYGFRGARPDLFTRLHSELPEHGRLPLSENFRSVPGILHFVNALFEQAFAELYQPLISRLVAPPSADPPVVFLWGDFDPTADKLSAGEARREEGRRIARFIDDLIRSGRTVRDRETGTLRPVGLSDIALLFRSMTDLAPYETAFSELGIDYHVIGSLAFFARQEIIDICNVLSMIEDPRDQVSAAGALRGPFFALSDEALYLLSKGGRVELFDGLREQAESKAATLGPEDLSKCRRAHALLSEWRTLKDRVPIAVLTDRVFADSGYEAALIAEPLGDRKRANARKVVRIARALDVAGGATFADFVEQLRADLRTPPRESEAATTDEAGEVVRLMSIHQSKGLEFPVVILPDLDRKPAVDFSRIAVDSEVGIVVNAETADGEGEESAGTGKNIGWLVYQHLKKERERAEALRVFYVAATRARDLLVLSSAGSPDAKPVSPAMELLDRRFERTSGRCRALLPHGWADPVIGVRFEQPGNPGELKARHKPDMLGITRTIREAPTPARRSPAERPHPPLGPRLARIQQLLKAAASDIRFHKPDSWCVALHRAARSLPETPVRATMEALSNRWKIWIEGEYGRVVSHRVLLTDSVGFDSFDFGYRGESGWNLVAVSLVESDEAPERARLMAAFARVNRSGIHRVENCLMLRLGEGGGLIPLDQGA